MFGTRDEIRNLADKYNSALYYKHTDSRIEEYKGHFYIKEYEDDVHAIITGLKNLTSTGVTNYDKIVNEWLSSPLVDSRAASKSAELLALFTSSRVSLIYGAAGTGKSTFINFISNIFNSTDKLYLANTNPAVDNLRRKVSAANAEFMTISHYLSSTDGLKPRQILFIDECSTVGNKHMRQIIERNKFKLLVLVGDTHQIESIRFGNWFDIAYYGFKYPVRLELKDVYRTTDSHLLDIWDSLRDIRPEITEYLAKGDVSHRLDNSIFSQSDSDEIILSLNYDGLYGINNINRFLQNSNPNPPVMWGMHVYKVGDPVLFNDSDRFSPWLYNNLKGRITAIDTDDDKICFTVEVNTLINGIDTDPAKLEILESPNPATTMVRFRVSRSVDDDDDNDSDESVVPFQIAYAISIHKAQGLEYNSVKIIITHEVEEQIDHNILYTAMTRACSKLKVYWSPETQNKIIGSLQKKSKNKDFSLLKSKYPDLF